MLMRFAAALMSSATAASDTATLVNNAVKYISRVT